MKNPSCKKKWEKEHPDRHRNDAYYQQHREEKVIISSLRTGHDMLRHHLYNKFKNGVPNVHVAPIR